MFAFLLALLCILAAMSVFRDVHPLSWHRHVWEKGTSLIYGNSDGEDEGDDDEEHDSPNEEEGHAVDLVSRVARDTFYGPNDFIGSEKPSDWSVDEADVERVRRRSAQ